MKKVLKPRDLVRHPEDSFFCNSIITVNKIAKVAVICSLIQPGIPGLRGGKSLQMIHTLYITEFCTSQSFILLKIYHYANTCACNLKFTVNKASKQFKNVQQKKVESGNNV